MSIEYPTVDDLIALNKEVVETIRVKKADRHKLIGSRKVLENILTRVRVTESDLYDKAAMLLIELVQKHPFASANRRTALAAAEAFMSMNGSLSGITEDPEVLKGVREDFYTVEEVRSWLKGHGIRKFRRFEK